MIRYSRSPDGFEQFFCLFQFDYIHNGGETDSHIKFRCISHVPMCFAVALDRRETSGIAGFTVNVVAGPNNRREKHVYYTDDK